MKVFVTGVNGQLGYDVVKELTKRNFEVVGSDITTEYAGLMKDFPTTAKYIQMDITQKESVSASIKLNNVDVVIHCAAWTAVDLAESEEYKEKVFAINVEGTKNIANVCKEIDAKMVYISTDYVFNGQGAVPWQPDDKNYQPLSYYGETKLKGELAITETLKKYFIVRTAWVFGINGKNFIKTMLDLSKKFNQIKVVNDQIGTPTYTFDLARLLVDMILTEKYGYYHATNEGGYISWYDFTCEIFKQAKRNTQVIPVSTAEYGISKAKRPFNSRLDKSKLTEKGFCLLPTWNNALERFLKELKENESN